MSFTPPHRRRDVAAALAVLAAGVAVQLSPVPAAAAPAAAVTPTSTTSASSYAGVGTTLVGMGVDDPDPARRLTVELSTTRGTLAMPHTRGLTLGYGNHWSGDASISFTGVEADIDTALASLQLVGDGTVGAATVSMAALPEDTGYVYAAPNQHFYEYVPAARISWADARAAAKLRTYRGMTGYLATMPTQALNDFVTTRVQGAINVWFGAYVLTTPPPPGVGRQWAWSDGPLASTVFTECTIVDYACVVVNDDGRFSYWAAGEPNNYYGYERAAVTNWNGGLGRWNDLNPVTNISSISGYVVEYGDRTVGTSVPFSGVLSTSSTVSMASAPDAPGSPEVTAGDGRLTVTFSAPADHGSAVEEYVVTATPSGTGLPVTARCTAPATSCTVAGLTNGTTYDVAVAATNVAGAGPAAAAGPGTPVALPGAPTALQPVSRDSAVLLSFLPPAADGGRPITSYDVSTDGGATWSRLATGPAAGGGGRLEGVVTGLTNGRAYELRVRAVNAVGSGAVSPAAAVSPAGPPGAPRDVRVALVGLTADVSWQEPVSDGGAPVVGYTVTSEPGGLTCTAVAPARTCTVTGLVLGTAYRFRVAASNGDASLPGTGASGDSASAPATTTAAPGAPDEVTGTSGDRVLSVRWRAGNPGTSAISRWETSVDAGATWQPVTALVRDGEHLRATVGGVRNGRAYDVRVRAFNASGPGAVAGTRIDEPSWFADPLSQAQRAALVRVPRDPASYRGPVRRTTAFATSADGTPAMNLRTLKGRQMQAGQAATLTDSKMFVFDTAVLTPYGRRQVRAMVASLTYVDAIRCEGNADYGGREARAARLARQRADVTCAAIRASGADVRTTSRGFSNRAPVVVGGRGHRDRTLNRRVVVVVTRG